MPRVPEYAHHVRILQAYCWATSRFCQAPEFATEPIEAALMANERFTATTGATLMLKNSVSLVGSSS